MSEAVVGVGPGAPVAASTRSETGALAAVDRAYARIAEVDRPEVWITLRPRAEVEADVRAQLDRAAAGADLPLLGRLVAVKNNIDVAGIPTTAACPGATRTPERDATVVARLRDAGAVVLGATNLDQFATGLVGTRSPYGAVRAADHPDRISGGSSSGSAVAVALGIVDLALGTDTAGSGRVPAALNGLVGVKPTLGLVPTTGVLPACRSLDCVSVFARDLALAARATALIAGPDGQDALVRPVPADAPLAADERPVLAVPRPADLTALAPSWRAAFDRHLDALRAAGHVLREIDLSPFLAAARLLYDGAFVAERYAAVGALVDPADGPEPDGLDPVVAGIVRAAADLPAHRYAADLVRLAELRAEAEAALTGADALVLPTTTHHPTLAEVAAAPVAVNSRLGTFTNFCNLFGYAAVAVPVDPGTPAEAREHVGVMVLARPFQDAVALDVAARLLDVAGPDAWGALDETPAGAPEVLAAWHAPLVGPGAPATVVPGAGTPETATGAAPAADRAVDLLVVGAHLSGLPLHARLRRHGAVPVHPPVPASTAAPAGTPLTGGTVLPGGTVRTAPGYRLVALGDPLDRPGLVRAPGDPGRVTGELWRLPRPAVAELLTESLPPLGFGWVTLEDGRTVLGYLCEDAAARHLPSVPGGSWRDREASGAVPATSGGTPEVPDRASAASDVVPTGQPGSPAAGPGAPTTAPAAS
jgi:allophanate hydrolase